MIKFQFWSLLLLLFGALQLVGQNATTILKRSLDHLQAGDTYAELDMDIQRSDWSKQMSFNIWVKGEEMAMIQITAPEHEKGLVFLKQQDEIWNWQPSIQKAIKMPASMMMQSWMGSDFSHDNLLGVSSFISDFEHQLEGSEMIDGRDCWKLTLTALSEADVLWGKVVTWIDKERDLQMKTAFYDEEDYLIHTVVVDEVDERGSQWLAQSFKVIPAETEGEYTHIRYRKMDMNAKIPASFFTLEQAKNLP